MSLTPACSHPHCLTVLGLFFVVHAVAGAEDKATNEEVPSVPEGFVAELYAREPLIRNPAGMCFDRQGRLFVGQGPQFRKPKPDTPGDSIQLLLDTDDDGVADTARTFAEGFNCIQSLAWKGNDLWVANAPDFTIVRDLDGDDVADEYVLVYADMGNLEHGLHGLNWGPDGKLYMAKGNSKGKSKEPDRVAPKIFRTVWDVESPPGAPDHPPPRTFTRQTYKKDWHNPNDDWGRTGGIFRCDDMGKNPEVVSLGNRNPWDLAFDDGFNLLSSDNDQNRGDKIFMPFHGAHFGWGHPWSYNWRGLDHPPTVPASGPYQIGSATGVYYYDFPNFPESHRRTFFFSDYGTRTVFCYRPRWDGALLQNVGDEMELFARAGKALFSPTDVVAGPDGALYIGGWGSGYGVNWKVLNKEMTNEGRVYRVRHEDFPLATRSQWFPPKRTRAYTEWTYAELVDDLRVDRLPVWRVDAQTELVRRGLTIKNDLVASLEKGELSRNQETWVAWTLGRIGPGDKSIDAFFGRHADPLEDHTLNLRLQVFRILAHRTRTFGTPKRLPETVVAGLEATEPRVRFEAVQAIWATRQSQCVEAVANLAATETDRATAYSAWNALRDIATREQREALLEDERNNVRFAALLGFLGTDALSEERLMALVDNDPDPRIQEWALRWAVTGSPGRVTVKKPGQRGLDEVRGIIALIRDVKSPRAREYLFERLGRMTGRGDEDANAIRRLLEDLEPEGNLSGKEISAMLRALPAHPLTLSMLWRLLSDPREEVHGSAVDAFARLGGAARKFLHEQLPSTEDSGQRAGGVAVLAKLEPPKNPSPPDAQQVRLLAETYTEQDDARVRANVLTLLEQLDWSIVAKSDPKHELVAGITRQAAEDARPPVQRLAPPLATKLGIEVVTKPSAAATHEGVIASLAAADPERGRALFYDASRANCFGCHRVGTEGSTFAPPLSDIGVRATLEHIVESVLKPSAKITEGYRATTVVTRRGNVFTGVARNETEASFELVQADGRAVPVETSAIAARTLTTTSIMPRIADLLTAEEISDVVAWLRLQKAKPTDETTGG